MAFTRPISRVICSFEKSSPLLDRSFHFKYHCQNFSHFGFVRTRPRVSLSAGRNVDDQVYYIAFTGDIWRNFETRIEKIIAKQNLLIRQGNNEIIVTKNLFKELPFNHAKEAPNIAGQGLIYLSSKFNINPQLPLELVYNINNKEDNKVKFNLNYKLPTEYYLKSFSHTKPNIEIN